MTKPASHRYQLDAIAPPHVRAEAAVWVTELHSPTRDAQVEVNVRRWIAEDPRHAAAFELATEAWQRSGNLTLRPARKRALYVGIAALCAALASVTYFLTDDTLSTGPNEQKTVALSDGTEVTLNANSRLSVHFDDHLRRLTLNRGEVLFNVAKHLPRPFVVIIGDRKVIAMGTAFEVRRDESPSPAFTVTLVEGRVAIEPLSAPDVVPASAPTTSRLTLLNPGDRLRVTPKTADTLDHPKIDTITAWQRGQLIFDDVSLGEAAQEFNRFGTLKIKLVGAAAAQLRVGGVFRIGDPTTFAQTMADTYKLHLTTHGNEIILTD